MAAKKNALAKAKAKIARQGAKGTLYGRASAKNVAKFAKGLSPAQRKAAGAAFAKAAKRGASARYAAVKGAQAAGASGAGG